MATAEVKTVQVEKIQVVEEEVVVLELTRDEARFLTCFRGHVDAPQGLYDAFVAVSDALDEHFGDSSRALGFEVENAAFLRFVAIGEGNEV